MRTIEWDCIKFGGTSLGSPEGMKHVAGLVKEQAEKIQETGEMWVVLSAVSGTTNTLYDYLVFNLSFKKSGSRRKEARQQKEGEEESE